MATSTEQAVIDAATKAGFKLDGKSEVNANPKDTKDHPFGVWTLPPVRQSSANAASPSTRLRSRQVRRDRRVGSHDAAFREAEEIGPNPG